MAVGSKFKIGTQIAFPGGDALQTAYGSGSRLTVQATAASSSAGVLPSGARLLYVRASGSVWLRFGGAGIGAAAADDNSILFPIGESVMPVPLDANRDPYTHVRVLAAGDDCYVQFESIPHVDGV